jgi:hypothetical protein
MLSAVIRETQPHLTLSPIQVVQPHHRSIFRSLSCVGAGEQKVCFGQGTSLLLYIYLGALRFWTDVPAHFTALKLPLLSTMLNSAITIVEAALRQSSYQDKSVVLWVSFARTGNPNHADLPHWPKYTSEHRATLQFDRKCEVRRDPESLGLRLIEESP